MLEFATTQIEFGAKTYPQEIARCLKSGGRYTFKLQTSSSRKLGVCAKKDPDPEHEKRTK